MTGRELILYILSNNLEDEPIFKDGRPLGFVTAGEVAIKLNVGVATVRAWIQQGLLDSVTIGNVIYIPAGYALPHEKVRQ